MLKPAKIYHCTIYVPSYSMNNVIDKLGEQGICQIKSYEGKDSELPFDDKQLRKAEELHSRLKIVHGVLEKHRTVVSPENILKSLFFPSPPKRQRVDLHSLDKALGIFEYKIKELEEKVLPLVTELGQIDQDLSTTSYAIEQLSLLPDIATKWLFSSRFLEVIIGVVASQNAERLEKEINSPFYIKSISDQLSLVIIIVAKEQKSNIDHILHESGFQAVSFPSEERTPREIIYELHKKESVLRKKIGGYEDKIMELHRLHHEEVDILHEEILGAQQKIHVLQDLYNAKSFGMIEAWVPLRDIRQFGKVVIAVTNNNYYMEFENNLTDAPSLLSNPWFIRPFELITNLYSTPKYNHIDPTIFIALSFVIFFGFMLTDVVYGTALLLIAFGIYQGAGKYNQGTKEFSFILIIAGFFTALLGALFGSYFGNFFQSLGWDIPTLLDPMRDVVPVLIITLLIGSVHVLLGLLLGFIENISHKKYKSAFQLQAVWIFFLAGIVCLLGKGVFLYVGFGLIGLAVLMQMVFNFLDGGIIMSVLSVFSFTGFLGDIFSYARLMALAIGTAGIALAVNFMALMVIDLIPYAGWPLGILIFIVGHLFNMMMNGLGAFIHALRLHFLEFFSKFYEGGGSQYKPFSIMRKVTFTEVEKW